MYGVFVTFAAAFILSSVWQISSQLFGFASAARPEAPHLGAACSAAIAEDLSAIDVALGEATTEAYQKAKEKTWKDEEKLQQGCSGDPAGPLAIAALLRFERAAEAHVRRRATELGPVRREVESFIR